MPLTLAILKVQDLWNNEDWDLNKLPHWFSKNTINHTFKCSCKLVLLAVVLTSSFGDILQLGNSVSILLITPYTLLVMSLTRSEIENPSKIKAICIASLKTKKSILMFRGLKESSLALIPCCSVCSMFMKLCFIFWEISQELDRYVSLSRVLIIWIFL